MAFQSWATNQFLEDSEVSAFAKTILDDSSAAAVRTTIGVDAAGTDNSTDVTLATVAALNKTLDDMTILNLGVDAAIEAKVTITGAFDDACASYFGGVVVTDNLKRKIVKRFKVDEALTVLFYVPAN